MERGEKFGIVLLLFLFIGLSAYILSFHYDPQEDIVDGVAIDDWGHLLLEGKWQIPLEEWMDRGFKGHQSGLVQRDDGTIYVVPEKGVGFCLLYAFFLGIGLIQFLGVVILGIALISTYYLARTLVGTRAAVITGIFLLTSALALMMTYRYAWVDMGTMGFLAAGFALFLYSQRLPERATDRERTFLIIAVGVLAGVIFCWAVAMRYVLGVALIAPLLYVAAEEGRALFSLQGFWRGLKRVLPFMVGMFAVLLPLLYFNTVAYGGPFMSGYDVYRLSDFFQAYQGPIQNMTIGEDPITSLDFVILSDLHNNVWQTAIQFAAGMPCFFFAWFGIWRLRRERPALALLGGWFLAVYCMYLTVGHMGDMGVRGLQESRYFLPMLGAIVVLGGAALHFPKWSEVRHWALVFILFALLLPLGFYFATENITKFGPQGQHMQQTPPTPIDLYILYDDPSKFNEKIVYVKGLEVVKVTNSGYVAEAIESTGSEPPPRILLICRDCPQPPGVGVGTPLDALGIFRWDDKDGDGVYDEREGLMSVIELVEPDVPPAWPPQRPSQQQPTPTSTPLVPMELFELYASPQTYANQDVYIVNLVIDRTVSNGLIANSTSGGQDVLRILLVWKDGPVPDDLTPGTPLEVKGIFRWDDKDNDGVFDPQEERLEVKTVL